MPIPSVTVGQAVTQSESQAIIDGINAQGQRVIITANTTWAIPAAVYRFKVTLCGGGGAFGSSFVSGGGSTNPGLNGGDSPMCSKYISGVDPGTSIPVTVGSGGSFIGGNGGTTAFGSYFQSTGGVHSNGPTQGARGTHTGEIAHSNGAFVQSNGKGYGSGGDVINNSGAPGIVIIEW